MGRNMKWVVVVLCLTVLAAMALGCGQSGSNETKQVVTSEGAENGNGGENAPDGTGATDASDASQGSDASSGAAATIEEQTLIDQDGIVVTATEYVTDVICCGLWM